MKSIPTHTIHHRYLNRYGVACERMNTAAHGTTDEEAQAMFDAHIRFAETAWEKALTWNGTAVRITEITLRNAAGDQLATWTRPVEGMVAA